MNYVRLYDLTGKTAIVTGAAHGIGRASALALSEAGAKVAILDLNGKGLQVTSDMIREKSGETFTIEGNITDENGILKAVENVISKWGRLDIAHCNAGTFQDIPAETMTLEEFKRVIDVNLTGQFITARAVGRQMIERKSGSIILTASMSGHIANIPQCQCAYNASKAGVIMLGKSLAIEWAKHNIRVNTISPGYVRTWSDDPLKPEEVGKSNFEQWTPMKRFASADEIACLIQYLASEAGSFVTGSDILIDGGYTAF
jgi:NAD(P)-dependent dehydrogenase (short-subunit alcohol dehydrogenase family)